MKVHGMLKTTEAKLYRNLLCAKHCPNIILHDWNLYHCHFTDEQTGAPK